MISIVDDDVCARKATEAIIRSLGYALATYESAEDFLSSNHVNSTSCLITDVHMPGLSCVELYRHLSSNGFAAPTIFVTGQPDEATREQVLAAGAAADVVAVIVVVVFALGIGSGEVSEVVLGAAVGVVLDGGGEIHEEIADFSRPVAC